MCIRDRCKRCHGIGHEESSCSSPADIQAVLAVKMPSSDSDADTNSDEVAAALMAMELKKLCLVIFNKPLWCQASLLVAVPSVV